MYFELIIGKIDPTIVYDIFSYLCCYVNVNQKEWYCYRVLSMPVIPVGSILSLRSPLSVYCTVSAKSLTFTKQNIHCQKCGTMLKMLREVTGKKTYFSKQGIVTSSFLRNILDFVNQMVEILIHLPLSAPSFTSKVSFWIFPLVRDIKTTLTLGKPSWFSKHINLSL